MFERTIHRSKSPRATARRPQENAARGRALKARLTALGITQAAICEETGLHAMTINRALNHGMCLPTIRVIEAIIEREESALAAA